MNRAAAATSASLSMCGMPGYGHRSAHCFSPDLTIRRCACESASRQQLRAYPHVMASADLQRQICEALPDLLNDHASALYLCMRQHRIADTGHLKGLVSTDFT